MPFRKRFTLMPRDKSLVQGAELWVPQGEVLGLGSAAFRGEPALGAERSRLRFHYGEGLPGAVWANGRALLWRDLPSGFVPAPLAGSVDAALGLPLFDGDRPMAVLTLLLGNRGEAPSCIEIWDVIDELNVLKHGRGYYAHCGEFERLSPFIQFQRGTGLPGLTWLGGETHVMEDVRKSNAFVRAGLAALCGLKFGVGLPIHRDRQLVQVVACFGAEQQSFIANVELYRPHGSELGAATVFDWSGLTSARGQSSPDAPGRALAQEVLQARVPAVRSVGGSEIVLALPLCGKKGLLKEIVVLRM